MNNTESQLRRIVRSLVRPFGKCLLFFVNPVLERRDTQVLQAIHNLVRMESDKQESSLDSLVAMSHQIVHRLRDIRECQHRSHAELMHAPFAEMQGKLDTLVEKNQATMQELQLTLDSLIREVVRVEGRTAQLQAALDEPAAIIPRRRSTKPTTNGTPLRVHSDANFIRPVDLESTDLFQRSG